MVKHYLNPIYSIRNDCNCSFIYLTNILFNKEIKYYPKVMEIPPLHGYILSQFAKGGNKDDIINNISATTNIKRNYISKFINQIIHNKNILELKLEGESFRLPPNLLIESEKEIEFNSKVLFEENFSPFKKFIKKRPTAPASVNIVLTTKCKTDCIYCYADRNMKIDFKLDKILSIIEDCFHSNILTINISGGDIFAFKEWRQVIDQMYRYNYTPTFLSTKIPLTEKDIQFLYDRNIHEIQFSLDSSDPKDLELIVKRNSQYIEDIKSMFNYCRIHKVKVNVKTVITKYNSKERILQELYDLLCEYNINSWNLVPAFSSHYKESYDDYRADNNSLVKCESFLNKLIQDSKLDIVFKSMKRVAHSITKYTTIENFIGENKECIATSHNLSINILGQVTVCEMLYNKNKFFLGNIEHDSIKELWNSDAIKSFSNFNLFTLPRNPESPCYQCIEYKQCKTGNLKKICLVDIIEQYGEDRWDYPDPHCPHAPACDMNLLIK